MSTQAARLGATTYALSPQPRQHANSKSQERRRSERIGTDLPMKMSIQASPYLEDIRVNARVINISRTGLRLQTALRQHVGKNMHVIIRGLRGGEYNGILDVVRSTKAGNLKEVGCRILSLHRRG